MMGGGAADKKVLVIVIAVLFLLAVAILLDLQYLYLMAAALAVLPWASYLLARYLPAQFRAVREHATTTQEGRLTPITLHIAATGGLPLASLRVADAVPGDVAPAAPARSGDPVAGPPPPTADDLAPLDYWDGQEGHRAYAIEPKKRGVYRLGPARILTTDPLGLFTFPRTVGGATEIVVHPTPIPASDTAYGGEGAYGVRERDGKSVKGDGMDFHGVREYRHGDALRRVHWPTTARTGKLAVVEFERAYQRDIVIGLDATRGTDHGTGRDTTLEYAVKVAATLVDRTLAAGGGATLVTQRERVTLKQGDVDVQAGRFRLFDLLARLEADADTSLAEALQAARPEPGSHFAILTSWGDPRLSVYLAGRMAGGDTVSVLFFEPASFGGPRAMSPAVAGARLRVVACELLPWREGGKELAYLLQDEIR